MGKYMEQRSKYEVMEEMAQEILGIMEDLYQSGFDTVHDTTLKDLEKAAKAAGQYGLSGLSELLSELYEGISLSRHQMEKRTDRLAELYVKVSEYLYHCRQKTAYDRGLDYYS